MKAFFERHGVVLRFILAILIALSLGAGSFAFFQYRSLTSARAEGESLAAEVVLIRDRLAAAEVENEQLRTLLQEEAAENEAFGARVQELANSVIYLDKLSKTDRELLQKYSSVYFLNENFVPNPLVPIDDKLLARPGSNLFMHGSVYPFFEAMMQAAKSDGVPLLTLSAYRSFGEQSVLKNGYRVSYGSGANTFSADQGYSEHQLGSTVDLTTPEKPESLVTSFSKTPQYSWLQQHAYEYGFILSYPESNAFFQFEPWHWRFVGKALAKRLYYENKHFYDLDQREINPYLSRIFDQ